MYDFIQSALTATIEVIALIAIVGLPAHYIVMSHVREVQSWGTPYTTPAPHVEVEPKAKTEVEAVVAKQLEFKPEAQTVAIRQPEAVKLRKTGCKKTHQPKLQPMSVGGAAVDYTAMTSEQLRKECALQGVNWRTGGDYSKPMKKSFNVTAIYSVFYLTILISKALRI
jgi:hypothetical protein